MGAGGGCVRLAGCVDGGLLVGFGDGLGAGFEPTPPFETTFFLSLSPTNEAMVYVQFCMNRVLGSWSRPNACMVAISLSTRLRCCCVYQSFMALMLCQDSSAGLAAASTYSLDKHLHFILLGLLWGGAWLWLALINTRQATAGEPLDKVSRAR